MEDDRIWILFARHVSGEINPEESKELEALVRERPDQGYSIGIIQRFFDSGRILEDLAGAGISTMDAAAAK
jgi:hypothetical protein